MINAEFFIKNSSFSGFRISGHAGYSESGSDIVCASVSSAVQLTANTITDFFGIGADVSAEGETIILETSDSESLKEVNLLVSSLKAHLEIISEEFPETLNITTTEV